MNSAILAKEHTMRYMTEWEEKGLEGGILKGRMEGQIKMIANLLELRFGTVVVNISDSIGHLDVNELITWQGNA